MLTFADFNRLLARAESVLDRLEAMLPPAPPPPDWRASAFRWRKRAGRGYLQPIAHPHVIRLDDLVDLPDIADITAARRERFVVFCDDLTFDAGEPGYKALKVTLDGTVAAAGNNMLIYATSNRRHLLPEYFSENLETKHVGGEVHPGESVEEKISLSERFGMWISFYPFSQDDYLAAVAGWLAAFGVKAASSAREREAREREALQFALQRGSRSGRVAWQFARSYAGASALRTRGKRT